MKYTELLALYILEILAEYAHENKRIYQKDILMYLDANYQIEITRKTLGKYLSALRAEGFIAGERGIYKVNKFSNSELRVLIDSVLFAQHIPAGEAKEIIKKLKEISPKGLENKVRHIHYVQDLSRTENDSLYPILDQIDEAIERRRQILITVSMYNINAELVEIRQDIIHPYYIVNSNSRYYVICYAGRGSRLESRRIDRISKVAILDEVIHPLRKIIGERQNFDLGQYMREHIYMFSGDSVRIKLKMRKEHIGYFIDWYGTDYRIVEEDADNVTIGVKANENATYYWALQYGHLIEIVEPLYLREKMKQGLETILKKYK